MFFHIPLCVVNPHQEHTTDFLYIDLKLILLQILSYNRRNPSTSALAGKKIPEMPRRMEACSRKVSLKPWRVIMQRMDTLSKLKLLLMDTAIVSILATKSI